MGKNLVCILSSNVAISYSFHPYLHFTVLLLNIKD